MGPSVLSAILGVILSVVTPVRPGPAGRALAEHGVWPVVAGGGERPTVVRGLEPPPSPWAAGHRGVDLAAHPGQLVRAAESGTVTFAGPVGGRGAVTVEHPALGRPVLRTTYQPLAATVHKGDRVLAGQPLGRLQGGPSHCAGGCLHWGLLRGSEYLDPLVLLPVWLRRGRPPALLPVFG